MESLGDILKRLALRSTSEGTVARTGREGVEEGPPCPLCKGTGWIRREVPLGHPDFGKALPCHCQERETQAQRLARLRRYSNLGPLSRITFQGTNPEGVLADPESRRLFQEAHQAALVFAQDPQGWLVFSGPSGCGKTHLAAAIANGCMAGGHPAFFMVVPDLLDHLRGTFAPESPVSYDELFEQVRNAPVLILDDLGTHSGTPWAQEKLFQVLNHRFNARLPTVIALSVPLERLEERLRSRLEAADFSRLFLLGRRATQLLKQIGGLEGQMLQGMTFERFDVRGNHADAEGRTTLEAALRGSRNYARDPHGWLLLIGPNGCGKTHLAVAIANHRLKHGQPVLFAFVPALLDHLRATFSPQSLVAYDELFEGVKTSPFLILDDLGSESSTPWAEEKLYQIIVHRHNTRLPTVITAAGNIEFRPAIASRLSDPRVIQVLEIRAPDYRAQERIRGTPRARRSG